MTDIKRKYTGVNTRFTQSQIDECYAYGERHNISVEKVEEIIEKCGKGLFCPITILSIFNTGFRPLYSELQRKAFPIYHKAYMGGLLPNCKLKHFNVCGCEETTETGCGYKSKRTSQDMAAFMNSFEMSKPEPYKYPRPRIKPHQRWGLGKK